MRHKLSVYTLKSKYTDRVQMLKDAVPVMSEQVFCL